MRLPDPDMAAVLANVLNLTHEEYAEMHGVLQASHSTDYMREQLQRLEAKEETLIRVVQCLVEVMAARKAITSDVATKLSACVEDLDSASGRRRMAELLPSLQSRQGKDR